MANSTKSILSLTSEEAINYFLKSEQYHGFELPEYFVFDDLLQFVKEKIADTPYQDCLQDNIFPDALSDVNLDIMFNKDGHYAVRPMMLANPYLYYFLVRELCCEPNWRIVKDLFSKFQVPHITSCALPVVAVKQEPFYKSTTVLHWWNMVEQRSVELSLEYRYMFVTDITNCYGSINPQSIEWAFSLKNTKEEKQCDMPIAQNIQTYLRAMQQGRNIGIPQGSAIFDLLGEIVLGYSDLLLHEAIQTAGITVDYEIIRYRDDYRIFCNDKDVLEKISYILQQVLESLNFRMNSQKTKVSESIITDSIKSDKLSYICNTPIFNKKGCDFDSFEKHLLYILMFGRKYPNSGQMKVMLSDIDKRIREALQPRKRKILRFDENFKVTERIVDFQPPLPGGSVRAMSAIAVQIALENTVCSHYALRVFSRMINSLSDEKEKWDIIDKAYAKLCNLPNSTYNQLWLQNITFQQDRQKGYSPYTMRLCKLVMMDNLQQSVQTVEGKQEPNDTPLLWNLSWLKPQFRDQLPYTSIVNREILEKATPIITFREIRAYDELMAFFEKIEHLDPDFIKQIDELEISVDAELPYDQKTLDEINAKVEAYLSEEEHKREYVVSELTEDEIPAPIDWSEFDDAKVVFTFDK